MRLSKTGPEVQGAGAGPGRHRVGENITRLRVGDLKSRASDDHQPTFGDPDAGIGDQYRGVVDRRNRQPKDGAADAAARSVADGERETVAGDLAAVLRVAKAARINLRLSKTGPEVQGAGAGPGRHRVGEHVPRIRVGDLESAVQDRRPCPFGHGQARVDRDHRSTVRSTCNDDGAQIQVGGRTSGGLRVANQADRAPDQDVVDVPPGTRDAGIRSHSETNLDRLPRQGTQVSQGLDIAGAGSLIGLTTGDGIRKR